MKNFTKIAVVVLDKIVKSFTAKWHKLALANALKDTQKCQDFRKEHEVLQVDLRRYTKMLSDMAGVEDLTEVEEHIAT